MRIELHHPIANNLQCHAADPSGLRTRRPVIDCRQRQKPPACGPSFVFRAKTRSCRASKSDRIGMGMANLLLFAALNQIAADLGIPPRVTLSGTWYKRIAEIERRLEALEIQEATIGQDLPHLRGTHESDRGEASPSVRNARNTNRFGSIGCQA